MPVSVTTSSQMWNWEFVTGVGVRVCCKVRLMSYHQ